jgi:ribosome biogenesis GTPase
LKGTVIKSTGSWYIVRDERGELTDCRIKGNFRIKGIKSTNPIAVGDKVVFEYEANENYGIINEIEVRKNYIIRKSVNLSKQTHIIAANIDQAMLVVTLASPRTSTGFIDRFLATAEAYSITSILVFNKYDLYDEEQKQYLYELITVYEKAGYVCIVTSIVESKNIDVVGKILKGKTTLLAGHSGVGKSTLINAAESDLQLRIGELSSAHDKGKHTTTFAEMHPLKEGGYIIDTPGIKEFGMVDMDKKNIAHYFPEMRALLNQCRFDNCTHVNEPGCAVKLAVEKGEIALFRFENYLNILGSNDVAIYEQKK